MNLSRLAIISFVSSSMLWSVAQAQSLPSAAIKNLVVDVQTELQLQTAQAVKAQLEDVKLKLLPMASTAAQQPVLLEQALPQSNAEINEVITAANADETPLQMAQIQP